MIPHGHRRRFPLFLLAIILPSAVMVILGLRMIGQEQELAEKRLHDEQLRVTGQVRQEISSRLERIALKEVTALVTAPDRAFASVYDNPAVALVARIEDGRIVLPWEGDNRPDHSRRLMEDPDFAHRISQGEHEELVTGNLGESV